MVQLDQWLDAHLTMIGTKGREITELVCPFCVGTNDVYKPTNATCKARGRCTQASKEVWSLQALPKVLFVSIDKVAVDGVTDYSRIWTTNMKIVLQLSDSNVTRNDPLTGGGRSMVEHICQLYRLQLPPSIDCMGCKDVIDFLARQSVQPQFPIAAISRWQNYHIRGAIHLSDNHYTMEYCLPNQPNTWYRHNALSDGIYPTGPYDAPQYIDTSGAITSTTELLVFVRDDPSLIGQPFVEDEFVPRGPPHVAEPQSQMELQDYTDIDAQPDPEHASDGADDEMCIIALDSIDDIHEDWSLL